jgi:hypothetical protein
MTDLESAMKKVTDLLHSAARRSGEIIENTKISYTISVEKDKISKLQSKIGEKFYKIYKDGGSVPDQIVEDLAAIAAIEETIRTLEKTLNESKPYKFCSECGTRLDLSDVYCAKCGAKQHDVGPAGEAGCGCDESAGEESCGCDDESCGCEDEKCETEGEKCGCEDDDCCD